MVKPMLKRINEKFKFKKNRKAQSEIVSYVILIAIGIGLSIGVFIWLKSFVNVNPSPNCEEGTSVILLDINCSALSQSIKLNIENSGRFTFDGVILTVSNETGLAKPYYLVPRYLGNVGSDAGAYFFDSTDRLKPQKRTILEYSLTQKQLGGSGFGAGIPLPFEQLRSIQIQPFIMDKKGIIICQNALIKQDVENCDWS